MQVFIKYHFLMLDNIYVKILFERSYIFYWKYKILIGTVLVVWNCLHRLESEYCIPLGLPSEII